MSKNFTLIANNYNFVYKYISSLLDASREQGHSWDVESKMQLLLRTKLFFI